MRWPEGLKHTATRDRWFKKLQKLKPGLSLHDVARAEAKRLDKLVRMARRKKLIGLGPA